MDGHVIPFTIENETFNINICNPTEHELRTCTKIDITSDISWNHEYVQQRDMIKPELYNDLLDDADNERMINSWRKIDTINSDWWKYNFYLDIQGRKL